MKNIKRWPKVPGKDTRSNEKFSISTVTLLPLLVQSVIGFCRKSDICWLYHISVCWITFFVYAKETIKKFIGIKPEIKDRETWQKQNECS